MRRSSTSSSEVERASGLLGDRGDRRAALAFASRVARFAAPLALVFALTQAALWNVGESHGIERVLRSEREIVSRGDESLFGRALVAEEMRRYKARELVERRPRIVALGSSTTMQLRGFHFAIERARAFDAGFYNAGGLMQHAGDLPELERLIEQIGSVRVIVLGLDPWWFNSGWAPARSIETIQQMLDRSPFDADSAARARAYPAAVEALAKRGGAARLARLFGAPGSLVASDGRTLVAIGLAAREGAGFRGSDGSRRNARFLARRAAGEPYVDDEDTVERIARGERRFEIGSRVDSRVAKLREFLAWARERDVVVGGFVVPFASDVRAAIASSPDHAAYHADFRRSMRETFAAADMPFVDAFDAFEAEGHDDAWMINGFHGSERTMAHVVSALASDQRFARAIPAEAKAKLACLIAAARRDALVEGEGPCAAMQE